MRHNTATGTATYGHTVLPLQLALSSVRGVANGLDRSKAALSLNGVAERILPPFKLD
jgi:hypothetical protein